MAVGSISGPPDRMTGPISWLRSTAPAPSPLLPLLHHETGFAEREVAYFLNIDFVDHVALAAVLEEAGRPAIVAVHATSSCNPGRLR